MNPLTKRLPRELLGELGKYLVIFLFLTGSIGFVSGFLVADNSMIQAYDQSFEKYNIEDGNFELKHEADAALAEQIERLGVTLYPNTYKEAATGKDNANTLRVFINRTQVNLVSKFDGEFPAADDEIAIDRMYADNNDLQTGDRISVGGKEYKITALVALSDYSTLFSDNSDFMFDSLKFCVAVMTQDGFENIPEAITNYSYSWKYSAAPEDDRQADTMSQAFLTELNKLTPLENYIPAYANQAIHFTGEDMGSDKQVMTVLLYILIGILSFIFAVTISNTIAKESAVIGTLRALGYTRAELLRHFLAMPVLVTLLASLVGNVLGYTAFTDLGASMYYGSYSLPPYKTIWNAEAFVMTTVIPFGIMLVINVFILSRKLQLSPLQFLRRDLARHKRKKAIRLPKWNFFSRFRLRILFQNRSGYLVMAVGILFAELILAFGQVWNPMLDHYQEIVLDNMISNYQYIVKAPVETQTEGAEKFSAKSLRMTSDQYPDETIGVFGISDNSRYVNLDYTDGVYVSDGYAEKYNLKKGDTLTLYQEYSDESYQFQIAGTYNYPAALSIFMSRTDFNKLFGNEPDAYNGYLSDNEITDIDSAYLAATVSEDDLTKVTRQLKTSMGSMMGAVDVFAMILFGLMIYLLGKLIVEKNAQSISMVKILGYTDREISRLYQISTTLVVVVSIILSMGIVRVIIPFYMHAALASNPGWLEIYFAPRIFLVMFGLGMAMYLVVAALEFKKIKRIPMTEALKNAE